METNDKLQKEQNEFSKQMDVIINDKKKLEEVYLLKVIRIKILLIIIICKEKKLITY